MEPRRPCANTRTQRPRPAKATLTTHTQDTTHNTKLIAGNQTTTVDHESIFCCLEKQPNPIPTKTTRDVKRVKVKPQTQK